MNWDEIAPHLAAPLSPDAIKPPPKGKYGEYVTSLHTIREANRIFGFDGWSYEVTTIKLTNATMQGDKHRIGYFAIVKVTVDGVSREDVGHGQGFGKSEGDAHDSAVKEAVTDGMKRCLRTFGNTFGLALYEKDVNAREVGYAPVDQSEDVARLKFLIEQAADGPALIGIKKEEKDVLDALTDDNFNTVKAAFAARKSELTEKKAA